MEFVVTEKEREKNRTTDGGWDREGDGEAKKSSNF